MFAPLSRAAASLPSTASAAAAARRGFAMPSYSATKPSGGRVVRPLSPHLTVYSFKENMLTSIVFRGCGILMTGGLAALAGVALASERKFPQHVHALQQVPLLNAAVKFGVAFPLSYHLMGGLRHIAWDNVRCESAGGAPRRGRGGGAERAQRGRGEGARLR